METMIERTFIVEGWVEVSAFVSAEVKAADAEQARDLAYDKIKDCCLTDNEDRGVEWHFEPVDDTSISVSNVIDLNEFYKESDRTETSSSAPTDTEDRN